jgi:hypothetical protein
MTVLPVEPWSEDELLGLQCGCSRGVCGSQVCGCMCLTRMGWESDKLDTLLIMAR